MIPSTTRASHAYSNDGCTVTAPARLTQQSFPTNKTLNTGPLGPLLSQNTAVSATQVGRNCTLGYICFSPTRIPQPESISKIPAKMCCKCERTEGDNFRFLVTFSERTYFIILSQLCTLLFIFKCLQVLLC